MAVVGRALMEARALITAIDAQDERAWETFLSLAPMLDAAVGAAWCLIGAQMVRVHAARRDAQPLRLTRDLDILGDVRVRQRATNLISDVLAGQDFALDEPSPLGTAHRFRRGVGADEVVIDVLAPDGLGSRTVPTTIGNAKTANVPGGTLALGTAGEADIELRRIDGSSISGRIRIPSLAGAVGIKAYAVAVSDAPSDQLDDLILLLSLVDDPSEIAAELKGSALKQLRRVAARVEARAGSDSRSLDSVGVLRAILD